MQYHDTHAHLDLLLQKLDLLSSGRELDLEFITNEKAAELTYSQAELDKLLINHEFVIQPGISTKNFYLNYHLFQDSEKVRLMLGAHPDMVNDTFSIVDYLQEQGACLDFIVSKDLIQSKKLIGIGEVGLDYFHIKSEIGQKLQRDFLVTQIELSVKLELPLVIHCRDAFEDLFKIVDNFPAIHGRWLIHCFTGGVAELQEVLRLGGRVAFGGVSTYSSAVGLQEAIKVTPVGSYVLETDLPFLSPTPNRGKTNLPEFIADTARHIGVLQGISEDQVWKASKGTVLELFGV
jgi:TatD DNase family protein